MAGILEMFTGEEAQKAAQENRALYDKYGQQATGAYDKAYDPTLQATQAATAAWSPVSALGQKYGQGSTMYMNALGLNGPEGTAAARGAFQTSPGYDWMRDQALESTARGINRYGGGGNEIAGVTDRASNLANQEYGSYLNRLQGFMPLEQQATTAAAGGTAAGKGAEAGFFQTDAGNRANIFGNVTSGMASANNAEAQAAQSSSNAFWTALMGAAGNAAKAAAGGGKGQ
jgi:hypothetical protein